MLKRACTTSCLQTKIKKKKNEKWIKNEKGSKPFALDGIECVWRDELAFLVGGVMPHEWQCLYMWHK